MTFSPSGAGVSGGNKDRKASERDEPVFERPNGCSDCRNHRQRAFGAKETKFTWWRVGDVRLICQFLVFNFMMAVSPRGGDYGGGHAADWMKRRWRFLFRARSGGRTLWLCISAPFLLLLTSVKVYDAHRKIKLLLVVVVNLSVDRLIKHR